ncbi:MAG: serine/threonine protein kinase, partial [Planctomycetes bacterium]|nr:serine/threonine protein kinase [Planctomycetota bacterium]
MHADSVVLKFLDAVDADLAAGVLRNVEDYVATFPGHDGLIRAEYARLRGCGAASTSARIGDRYDVIESLGRGGFGEVFLAEDSVLKRRVAIKLLSGMRALSKEWRMRLVREAEATNRIDDSVICPVHDVAFENGCPYLVMPWIAGKSLDRHLAAAAASGEGPIALSNAGTHRQRRDETLLLVERLARGLQTAHAAGVVHRDVKPANVIVRPDGRPVLIDFGIAWLASGEDVTRSLALGTPAYSPPEVLRGGLVAPDPRLDIWSLGVVLFECLTLRRPFVARPDASLERTLLDEPLPQLGRAFGRDLQAVLETALARRSNDRYATMSAFADDLERVRRGEPVGVRAAGPLRRLWGWARARP